MITLYCNSSSKCFFSFLKDKASLISLTQILSSSVRDSLLAALFPERLSGDNLPHQRSIVSSGDDLSSSLLSSQDGVIKTITLKKLMIKRKHLIMRLWRLYMKSCTKGDIRGLDERKREERTICNGRAHHTLMRLWPTVYRDRMMNSVTVRLQIITVHSDIISHCYL